MKEEALLCFICARNLEKVVSCWMDTRKGEDGPEALQVKFMCSKNLNERF